ncbi:MAG TPA: sugar kinase [Chitinivibrionales bacterium]|jgi:2-dehydro-3-deoxygluconokinase|nr:sugar kinase [Chitinivibrionales bacterium]
MKPAYVRDFDLLVIGETFVEMRCDGDIALADRYLKSIGGADIITAVTAARLGSSVSLVSAIACDPFHSFARETLVGQGINIDHTITCQGYNGLYLTNPRNIDEREYLFHRPGSAAQSITPALVYDDLIENSKIVYASSELQSVSKAARHTVFKAFNIAHINDIMVAYDPNLRLRLWSLDDAKESLWSVLPLVDVMLSSAPDESKALFGYERPLDVIGFLWDRGVSIVAVKNGDKGCLVGYQGKIEEFPIPAGKGPISDLTLIGSAFNGGFLHSIARGFDPFTAAQFANNVALFKGIKGGTIDSLPTKQDLS